MIPAISVIAMVACAMAAACAPVEAPAVVATSATLPQPLAEAAPVARPARADAEVAKAMDQLAGYCGALQAYVLGASLFGPEKRRATVEKAGIVLDRLCSDRPRDVAGAVASAAEALAAIQAARTRR